MNLLSPTKCAESVVEELYQQAHCADCDLSTVKKEILTRLVRQLVRDVYEHCAQIAEHYVPEHDLYEELDGLEVGEAVAEAIRKVADERGQKIAHVTIVA